MFQTCKTESWICLKTIKQIFLLDDGAMANAKELPPNEMPEKGNN